MMTTRNIVVTAGLSALFVGSAGCWPFDAFRNTLEEVYSADLGVTFYNDQGYGDGPAVVQMWQDFYDGSTTSQGDINAYMASNGGANSVNGILSALQNLTSTANDSFHGQYFTGQTCNGDKECTQQAVADIHRAALNNKAVAVKIFLGHFGVVTEAGASRYCTSLGCQPSFDWFRTHEPSVGPAVYRTAIQFGDAIGFSSIVDVFYPDSSWYMGVSSSDWSSQYDDTASTYYGESSPPEPNCPPYCNEEEEDPPIEENLTASPTEPGSRLSRERPLAHGVVVRNPRTREEIVANLLAGLKRTRLDEELGLTSLTLQDGLLEVGHVRQVKTEGPLVDYFLLSVIDARSRKPYAEATVRSDGLLGAVRLVDSAELGHVAVEANDARRTLSRQYGVQLEGDLQEVLGYGLAMSEFRPSFMGRDVNGRSVLIDALGQAFAVEPSSRRLSALPRTNEDR